MMESFAYRPPHLRRDRRSDHGEQGSPRKVAFPIISAEADTAIVAGADLGPIETTAIERLVAGLADQSGLMIPVQKESSGTGSLVVVHALQEQPDSQTTRPRPVAASRWPRARIVFLKTVQKDGRSYC